MCIKWGEDLAKSLEKEGAIITKDKCENKIGIIVKNIIVIVIITIIIVVGACIKSGFKY